MSAIVGTHCMFHRWLTSGGCTSVTVSQVSLVTTVSSTVPAASTGVRTTAPVYTLHRVMSATVSMASKVLPQTVCYIVHLEYLKYK